jgi:hypothetical protein
MDSEPLTNEALLKHFPNQFKLALYAISLAEGEIKRGQEIECPIESQNVATIVLAQITDDLERQVARKTPQVAAKKEHDALV